MDNPEELENLILACTESETANLLVNNAILEAAIARGSLQVGTVEWEFRRHEDFTFQKETERISELKLQQSILYVSRDAEAVSNFFWTNDEDNKLHFLAATLDTFEPVFLRARIAALVQHGRLLRLCHALFGVLRISGVRVRFSHKDGVHHIRQEDGHDEIFSLLDSFQLLGIDVADPDDNVLAVITYSCFMLGEANDEAKQMFPLVAFLDSEAAQADMLTFLRPKYFMQNISLAASLVRHSKPDGESYIQVNVLRRGKGIKRKNQVPLLLWVHSASCYESLWLHVVSFFGKAELRTPHDLVAARDAAFTIRDPKVRRRRVAAEPTTLWADFS